MSWEKVGGGGVEFPVLASPDHILLNRVLGVGKRGGGG